MRRTYYFPMASLLAFLFLCTNVCYVHAQGFTYNRTSFTTGMGPVAAVAADFNGDGKIDLAVVNQADNSVSILLSKPDSTFTPKVDYAVGTAPSAIVAVDFNGDGKADLAVLNSTANTVSILIGNGDGTFAPQTTVPVDASPVGIVASDFNGDGKIDLAVASTAANAVDILLGNGDGTFTNSTPAAVSSPATFASGDFNGDGKLDLVTVNLNQVATVLLSKGDGTFSQEITSFAFDSGPPTISAAVGDFDGDGKLDLVVVVVGEWLFLKGLGTGQFEPAIQLNLTFVGPISAGSQFVLADFNGDGMMDFASGNVVMLGLGSPFGFHQEPLIGEDIVPLIAADFNGDGLPDLVYTNFATGSSGLLLLGNGDGTFGQSANYTLTGDPGAPSTSGGAGAVAGDFNGDGKPDVAVFGYSLINAAITVGIGNGDGTFKNPVTSPIPFTGNASPVLADFNGDGKLDIATWSTITGLTTTTQFISIFPGDGDGTFQNPIQVPVPANASAQAFAVGDFDGDGKPDLAIFTQSTAAGPETEYVQVLLNNGGGEF